MGSSNAAAMDSQNIRAKIRTFLSQFVRVDGFEDGDDIFARGIVNSLFAMQLVMFVEKEFSITVENDDLDLGNFSSIDAIAAFVARKT